MNREIMIKEAIRRMKKLGIHQPAIEQFQEDGTVTRSETKFGFHYWVEEPELEWIRTFEAEHNVLVYYVIRTEYVEVGTHDTYLYVENEREEWSMFDDNLPYMAIFGYVNNVTYPDYSEFGTIGIKVGPAGGLVRTA